MSGRLKIYSGIGISFVVSEYCECWAVQLMWSELRWRQLFSDLLRGRSRRLRDFLIRVFLQGF